MINYVTRRPRYTPGGQTSVTNGNNGYLSVFTEYGGWGSNRVHPELQLLWKQGDGFRDNNAFEQLNGTLKMKSEIDSRRELYLKANVNHEDSEATYTGLTEYSFAADPGFNVKRDDQFVTNREAFDLVFTNEMSDRVSAINGRVLQPLQS